jgi:hypothetical protein
VLGRESIQGGSDPLGRRLPFLIPINLKSGLQLTFSLEFYGFLDDF